MYLPTIKHCLEGYLDLNLLRLHYLWQYFIGMLLFTMPMILMVFFQCVVYVINVWLVREWQYYVRLVGASPIRLAFVTKTEIEHQI